MMFVFGFTVELQQVFVDQDEVRTFGLRLLATEPVVRGGGKAKTTSSPKTLSSRWQFTVVGTWAHMRSMLTAESAFPDGLSLAWLEMGAPRPDTDWRRWVLTVDDAEAVR